jgi:hypothetical protein
MGVALFFSASFDIAIPESILLSTPQYVCQRLGRILGHIIHFAVVCTRDIHDVIEVIH